MDGADWANYAQIGMLAFAVPSTLVLFSQLADIRRTLNAEDFEATARRLERITSLCLEHPVEYDELAVAHSTYTTTASLVAEAILDAIDTEILRRESLPVRRRVQLPNLMPYFDDLFDKMPGLSAVLARHRGWYSDEIWSLRRGYGSVAER